MSGEQLDKLQGLLKKVDLGLGESDLPEKIDEPMGRAMVDKLDDIKSSAAPLMKYLSDNHNPHCTAIVTSRICEIVEGLATVVTDEFLKD